MKGFIVLFSAVAVSLLSTSARAYPSFQSQIPNGKNVPHPCIEGTMWEGVGHENALGAGARNAFGRDFDENGYKWDATLCRKDSDQDGKTNGEELGDPDCTWTVGAVPRITSGITHPGVCEPLGSQKCLDKTSFVVCADTSFNCPAINEPGAFAHEVRFPTTPVPAEETTYMCMTFEFPSDQEYHIIASEPIIDNREVMHHTLVFGCMEAGEVPSDTQGVPKKCGDEMGKCQELVALWAAGGTGSCVDENMGFLVGGAKGFKYAVIQQHWNNPLLRSGYTDSSGFKFYMTTNLRPNNAGVLMIGQTYLAVPPNSLGYVAEGSCTSDCMEELLSGDIYVTNTINHMHLLGKAQFTELRRDGSFEQYLARDDVYDYNAPAGYDHIPAVKISPGDELKTKCVFQSRGMDKTINFGEGTQDEMCLAFVTYYPKENLNSGRCTSWKSLDFCELERHSVKRGCDFAQLYNYNDTATLDMANSVLGKCTPFECRQECLDLVRRLKSDPCHSGDVGDLNRLYNTKYGEEQQKIESTLWYTRLDSCDWELFQEGYTRQGDIGISSSATWITASIFCVILIASLLSVLLYE